MTFNTLRSDHRTLRFISCL